MVGYYATIAAASFRNVLPMQHRAFQRLRGSICRLGAVALWGLGQLAVVTRSG